MADELSSMGSVACCLGKQSGWVDVVNFEMQDYWLVESPEHRWEVTCLVAWEPCEVKGQVGS